MSENKQRLQEKACKTCRSLSKEDIKEKRQ